MKLFATKSTSPLLRSINKSEALDKISQPTAFGVKWGEVPTLIFNFYLEYTRARNTTELI